MLKHLDGGSVVQDLLGYVVIIEVDVALEGIFQGVPGVEMVGAQDIGDAAIEPFHHAVRLGVSGTNQAVLDAEFSAVPVEGMVATRGALSGPTEAIGEGLVVVREEGLDLEGRGGVDGLEEGLSVAG